MSSSPETVVLTLGPAQKVTLDLDQGVVNARRIGRSRIDERVLFKPPGKEQGLCV